MSQPLSSALAAAESYELVVVACTATSTKVRFFW